MIQNICTHKMETWKEVKNSSYFDMLRYFSLSCSLIGAPFDLSIFFDSASNYVCTNAKIFIPFLLLHKNLYQNFNFNLFLFSAHCLSPALKRSHGKNSIAKANTCTVKSRSKSAFSHQQWKHTHTQENTVQEFVCENNTKEFNMKSWIWEL